MINIYTLLFVLWAASGCYLTIFVATRLFKTDVTSVDFIIMMPLSIITGPICALIGYIIYRYEQLPEKPATIIFKARKD